MTDYVRPTATPVGSVSSEPLRAALSDADDRVILSHWLPPSQGIVPRIRIGRRWISTLWTLPIGVAALVLVIALAQGLRELPGVRAFIEHYPGSGTARRGPTGSASSARSRPAASGPPRTIP